MHHFTFPPAVHRALILHVSVTLVISRAFDDCGSSGVQGRLAVVLVCISPAVSDVERVSLPVLHWPLVYLLWRNVYSGYPPLFLNWAMLLSYTHSL